MLPMYIMHGNIGHDIRSVILRLHMLTGCKVTSKIGTKYGALNAKLIDYLKTFGQSENLCHEEAEKAESYLIKVLRPSSACTTMNELRIESYIDKNSFLIQLPPTSPSIFVHILPSHFVILQYLNLLNTTKKSNVQELCFIPDKCLSSIPRYLIVKCGCKKICSRCCQCLFADIKCAELSACRATCESR